MLELYSSKQHFFSSFSLFIIGVCSKLEPIENSTESSLISLYGEESVGDCGINIEAESEEKELEDRVLLHVFDDGSGETNNKLLLVLLEDEV